MSLDPTASEFFFRSSIKKYFIDSFTTALGIVVLFDKTILYENIRDKSVSKWLVVNFGQFRRDYLSSNILEINCCTRKDTEGVVLSKLTDTVMGHLVDATQTDTTRRIVLYNTADDTPANWSVVGGMMVTNIMEGVQQRTPDNTKVKSITISLRWGSVI